MSLDERFNAAVEIIQKLPKDGPVQPSNDQKLQFYSLFKQATIGDVNTERPGMFNFVEKAKWDAWKGVEGTSAQDAKERYIKALLDMFEKISTEIDVNDWLEKIDPVVKANLTKIGK